MFGLSRLQPKIQRPRNVDSRKKAKTPSIASGAPKTSPTKREYDDQFIPNWNSWTSPVPTPIAKLITKIVPKKRVSRSQSSSPVRRQAVCMIASSQASPIVSGTKKKWKIVRRPNWTRARLSAASARIGVTRPSFQRRRRCLHPWPLGSGLRGTTEMHIRRCGDAAAVPLPGTFESCSEVIGARPEREV